MSNIVNIALFSVSVYNNYWNAILNYRIMIIAREQFNPYWLMAIREKALSKQEILKLELTDAIDKWESQFSVIPFRDASFVLNGMAKVVNKKLDYCIAEINDLLDVCFNPSSKRVEQLNSTKIIKKSRKITEEPSPQKSVEIANAVYDINETNNQVAGQDKLDQSVPDIYDQDIDVVIPSKNPPPGIEGSLRELGESLQETPHNISSIEKIRAQGTSSGKQSLFTPKIPGLDTTKQHTTPQLDITMMDIKNEDQLTDIAKELFENIDKNINQEEKVANIDKKNVYTVKENGISSRKFGPINSINYLKSKCEINTIASKIAKGLDSTKLMSYDNTMLLNEIISGNKEQPYFEEVAELDNTIPDIRNEDVPENIDIPETPSYNIQQSSTEKSQNKNNTSISFIDALGETKMIIISQIDFETLELIKVRSKSAPYHNIYFSEIARGNKSVMIKTFIELMNLLNKGLLSLEQEAQFGDIKIIGESIVDYTSLIAK